ncbi:hypothetical protein [Sphingomonas lenta]|uniref:hypothetical protein n=1 Tax=Sphingomonas lenta TaxID=1141887 RepID=UPI0011409ABD|nr:hypothetical protein [Sphingomonas lenta]
MSGTTGGMSGTTGGMSGTMGGNMTMNPSGGMMGGAGIAPQPIAAPEPARTDLPVCQAGQYDDCVQRGSTRRSSARRRR